MDESSVVKTNEQRLSLNEVFAVSLARFDYRLYIIIVLVLCPIILWFFVFKDITYVNVDLTDLNNNIIGFAEYKKDLEIDTKRKIQKLKVEIADDDKSRQIGLMFRTKQLTDTQGMLFVFTKPKYQAFWMKNVNFPIDILFISEEKKIINIHKNATPGQEEPTFNSTSEAKYALELQSGASDRLGISVGDKVSW